MDSPGYALGATATLVSQPTVLPAGGYCVHFMYSMYGQDVSTLRVYASEVKFRSFGEATDVAAQRIFVDEGKNILGSWGSPHWVAVGNKGDEWHAGGFELKVDLKRTYQIVFEAAAVSILVKN